MSDLKPETKFDKRFAARLKKEILQKHNASKINFNFMNKRIYFIASSVAVLGVVIIFVSFNLNNNPSDNWGQNNFVGNHESQVETKSAKKVAFVRLKDGAYGSLSELNTLAGNISAKAPAPLGLGGGGQEIAGASVPAVDPNMTVSSQGSTGLAAPARVMDSKMIAPVSSYKYVYKGEPLDLKDATGDVYRRLKGDGQMGGDLANLVSSQNLGPINLQSFRNLKMTNLSLIEDRDLGLMINFDFNEDSVYIYENWEKWRIPERDNCTDDACFNKYRLKIEDVPADEDLIAMSKNFLNTYSVSLDNYGEPSVENSWRVDYERSDKSNYYIPEYATVVYPLLINNEAVRDQSGNYAGLRVTINLLKKVASGLNGLMPYRYETSSYALETNSENIMKAVNNGGWNHIYYYNSGESKELELGTPYKSLIQTWKYTNGKNDELLVPALVFPVLNAPADYYGSKFISVPLVKEMLDEINNATDLPGGGVRPMPAGIMMK
jgi:hypothetical protein